MRLGLQSRLLRVMILGAVSEVVVNQVEQVVKVKKVEGFTIACCT